MLTETTSQLAQRIASEATAMSEERHAGAVEIKPDTRFSEAGIDSLATMMLFIRLESALGFRLIDLGAIDRAIESPNDIAVLLQGKLGERLVSNA